MTFEREVMAGLCLAVVWVNTGLIVAHGLGDLSRLRRLRRRLVGTVGRVQATGKDDGPSYRLIQAGRTRGDGAIHFHDRRTESEFSGAGQAEVPQGNLVIAAQEGGVWVWPTDAEVQKATRCASQAEFDLLAGPALHARGAERISVVRISGAANVAGGRALGTVLQGDPADPLIFSSDDPRARLLGLELRVLAVLSAILLVLVLLTGLCFVGPAFGTASVLAALALFVFFLLVQPLGVWLSESVRWPHEVQRGGLWLRRRVPEAATFDLGSRAASS